MSVYIRPIENKDYPAIIELFKEFALFEKLPEKMTNSVSQIENEEAFFNCFVAEVNGIIVGYTTYFYAYYSWVGKSLYLDDLYVTKTYRNKGIGKELLNTVINLAKESNCKKVRWQVSNWNTNARNFYKHIGAEIDDVELNCDLILK